MSGGYFDHLQLRMLDAAQSIELQQSSDVWSDRVKEKFAEGKKLLLKAAIYLQRIDYLIEGDDSKEDFFARLEDQLDQYEKEGVVDLYK